MKISHSWLSVYYPTGLSAEETSAILTNTGLEVGGVERVEKVKGGLKGLVIGEIIEVSSHPNADRLNLTRVNIGAEVLDIVCGAPNVKEGQKVVVATVGTELFPSKGDSFKIKKGKIRGEVSNGMICAEDEIGLGASHDGIMVLDKKADVGVAASDFFNMKEEIVYDIDLTPNRSDAISHFGVARDLFAYRQAHNNASELLIKPDVGAFKVDNNNRVIEVEVKDSEACPRYSGITISGITVGESPEWLKSRLTSIGLKPINNIVDITNFIQHEIGQPLHAFDADKIKGNKVVVNTLKQDTKFVTLDGEERKLDEKDLMICNEVEGMCIAGVFGGLTSGVTPKTTSIFIESAYFNPTSIRKTARRHGLNTDASFRYERGTDPEITIYALKRAALLVKEIAGGEISSNIVDVYPRPIEPVQILFSLEKMDVLIGDKLDRSIVKRILPALDIRIIEEDNNSLKLELPLYRTDVRRDVDVVEEILRIYGYNNVPIPDQLRSSLSFDKFEFKEKVEKTLKMQLNATGFWEIMTNSLSRSSYYSEKSETLVEMLNPLSSELDVLRQSLLFGSLEVFRYNANRKTGLLKCYEFGKIYAKEGDKFKEQWRLNLFLGSENTLENWNRSSTKSTYFDLKLAVEGLFEKINLPLSSFDANEITADDIFAGGMTYLRGDKEIVRIGELKPDLLAKFELNSPLYYADINWDAVLKSASKNKVEYTPISRFPVVRRDLALLLDEGVKFSQIQTTAEKTDRQLLKSVKLFDVYKGKGLDAGKKSYALSFFFGSDKKTLKDKEVDFAIKKIYEGLQKDLGATLRQGEI